MAILASIYDEVMGFCVSCYDMKDTKDGRKDISSKVRCLMLEIVTYLTCTIRWKSGFSIPRQEDDLADGMWAQ
eukprot:CAMPEP_0113320090 /NCGR_PEP_ID=MMETSP0010_2-20120614/14026_1 /TAXON_ID=216773 ORGANISM="Corethron hystrix, Strain 308" /NCGR_SAMPLE_ID=MMETSP0010_2 /ASSEMBLY_ACC=CAM_ASM_000155 /LENGTH=72 /DNA_ID=CAMNT_0000177779 /DNA_START=773 /DNA_END=991 /DNA_ORIENTATION=+ /assembly_acc=CAM_ASM_000155